MDKPEKALKELAKNKREIEILHEQIADLEKQVLTKETFVLGMEAALKYLSKADNAPKPATLRAGTDIEHARQILDASPTSLHAHQILEAMGKAITKEARISLAGSLARYASRDHIFCKTGPNTFGLIGKHNQNVVPFEPVERDEYA